MEELLKNLKLKMKIKKLKPTFKSFLNDYIQKEKTNRKKEMSDEKEELVEKAKKLLKDNNLTFRKDFPPGFKYKLKPLKNDDADYKLLESSIRSSDKLEKDYQTTSDINRPDANRKSRALKIYRVVSTDGLSEGSNASDYSQLLLLHGTQARNVEGILKTGFEPSRDGRLGAGVYLTDSIDFAQTFGDSFALENKSIKCSSYFFVSKVKQADVEVSSGGVGRKTFYREYVCKEPTIKVFDSSSYLTKNLEHTSKDKFDSKNNRLLQGSFQIKDFSTEKEVLAHHDLVIPVYLLQKEEQYNVKEIAERILYNNLRVMKFLTKSTSSLKPNILCTKDNHSNDFTSELILKALKTEIDTNNKAKLKFLKKVFDKKVELIIKQLTCKPSSVIEGKENLYAKYRTELLQKENDDYKLISSSVVNNKAENRPKILHLFKIHPAEKPEAAVFKNKQLLLWGIESFRVNDILDDGFPQRGDSEFYDVEYCATNHLKHEVQDFVSYCEVDKAVKGLSFVFVVTTEPPYRRISSDEVNRMEAMKDSRESLIIKGAFTDEDLGLETNALTPAYLIVFESV